MLDGYAIRHDWLHAAISNDHGIIGFSKNMTASLARGMFLPLFMGLSIIGAAWPLCGCAPCGHQAVAVVLFFA
jgi:hypothetical protein